MATIAAMNPEQRRRLALAILAAFALVVVLVIALPVWMLNRHYEEALADTVNHIERYNRIAGTRPAISRELDAIRAKETRRYFLRAGASALSAAEAQEAIRALVESSGARLITMQAPTSRDEGRYRQITVNVQLTANILALRKILTAIENNVPYLFVDNLVVRSQVPANFKPQPGVEPEMFVQFDISGYALTGT
jgi:hypothetical protein